MAGLRFPSGSKNGKGDLFLMTPIEFKVSTDKVKLKQTAQYKANSGSTIILPTPSSGITLSETGNWEEAAGVNHDATLKSVGQALGGAAVKGVTDSMGKFSGAITSGRFINDYASLAYQGSAFREFSYSWILIPSSADEAESIQNIIRTIRYYSLPNYSTFEVKYPYMWTVNPALESKIGIVLRDSVITNFTVNYSPEGVFKTYNTGHPVSVTMDITFKEIYRASDTDIVGSVFGQKNYSTLTSGLGGR